MLGYGHWKREETKRIFLLKMYDGWSKTIFDGMFKLNTSVATRGHRHSADTEEPF